MVKSKRKFQWDRWNFDDCGDSYIIAVDLCPNKADVPAWIVKADHLDPDVMNSSFKSYLSADDVLEGWCKFQVRSDWCDYVGPRGSYVVELRKHSIEHPGWFKVWVIRLGEWY